ncbi:proprotein convertase P-domain-containing protein, partial [bacterium]|nr:proprotein convertase P-domain-containing protein [bacterium]
NKPEWAKTRVKRPRPNASLLPKHAARASSLLVVLALAFAASLNGWTQTAETPYAVAEARVDAPIPDGDAQTGLSSSIFIPGDEPLESLQVAVQIDHPAVEQLFITLVHPDGTSVVLHNQTASGEAPFAPIYDSKNAPTQPLAPLLNKSPLGEWTLRVNDIASGQTGTLIGWGLKMQPPSVLTLPPPTPAPLPSESFLESSNFQASETITNAQSIDVNNDGLNDLFLHFANADRIDLYLASGETDAFLPFALNFSVENPQRVTAGDVNGDGKTDFIAASQADAAAVVKLIVFLANDAGGFSQGFQTQDISLITNLDALALVDVNKDDVLDIVLGGVPKLLTGVGDGSFTPQADLITLGRRFLGHADLDGDGDDELFVTRSRGGTSSNIDPYILYASADLTFNNRVKLTIEDPNFQHTFAASPEVPGQVEFTSISTTSEVEPTWFYSRVMANEDGFSVIEKRLPADSFST